MPMITNIGAAAARNFGFGASSAAKNYIEDVFSTYLFAGNGSTLRTINGINLSGKGGLVWLKDRNLVGNVPAADYHLLMDTERGFNNVLNSNNQAIQNFYGTSGGTVYSDGFSQAIGWSSSINVASWTFRKQAKFFDIVTYTGTGANRTIAHNLGSTPGCIIVKRIDSTASDWQVYHSGLTSATYSIQLNLTDGQASAPTIWNSTAPTSSVFSVGTSADVNASGGTYVAYIYASNAGGFGAAGTDNVITCGAYTGTGAVNNIVNLGYEPQWLMVKPTNGYDWRMFDVMRGLSLTDSVYLQANTSNAENDPGTALFFPTATGFNVNTTGFFNSSGISYIYIAIRRGPMKTPTDATKVFNPFTTSSGGFGFQTTGFPVDMQMTNSAGDGAIVGETFDRLRGINSTQSTVITPYLLTPSTAPEGSAGALQNWNNTGYTYGNQLTAYTPPYRFWSFGRAPGFFDEVCYTGTGANTTQTHNLGVAPELMIVKSKILIREWQVYHSGLTSAAYSIQLDLTSQQYSSPSTWNSTAPTSSVFSVGTDSSVNASGYTYVAYLFATCPGVSKVGSYSGTGATQTINCGFTGGARFVLIKRTDSTGDWYVWDTARGMVSGSDWSLLLNLNNPETNANSVYTTGVGFQIVSTAAGINASGGTYIYLAIA